MKTQYVGVIFTNDIQPGANAKTYYFKDNTGAAVGDELVVRLATGRLAVVEVVTVSDVAPSEKITLGHQLSPTLCKVDKSEEEKRKKYLENKETAKALYTHAIDLVSAHLPIEDFARAAVCAADPKDPFTPEAWQDYLEAEKLLKEVKDYEEEYGICESTSAK